MDSLSQLVLGAAVGVAVMGRRTAVWKAALWGGVCGTLPDLDAFINHGDPVSNMTLHRTDSHALFWLSLLAPLLAAGLARCLKDWAHVRAWCLATWLALITHPLLDLMTVYGTQLLRPFDSTPYGVGSIFIIDPLYTLPLMVGVGMALQRGPHTARLGSGLRWNQAGLWLSTAYLGWSALAQQHVTQIARASLSAQGLPAQQVLVTPTPFNTVLWRVVVMTPGAYHEGLYSLLDQQASVKFERFDAGQALAPVIGELPAVQRIAWFTRGFYKLSREQDQWQVTDLRMGQEPTYTFSFAVARSGSPLAPGQTPDPLAVPESAGRRPADIGAAIIWLWRRGSGQLLPPPR